MTPELALAASAREWPDRLHRHLLDHGGARVVQRVMSPDQVSGFRFDALLIDDVSSFLTPRFVTLVRGAGCEVIGVFDPDDGPHAKRRLLESGISDVVDSSATPDEFLGVVHATVAHRHDPPRIEPVPGSSGTSMGVTGVSGGVGSTEVAVGLGKGMAASLPTVLVDLDPTWPSVAQRLDIPLYPNLRTTVDQVLHNSGEIDSSLHLLGELSVVVGAPGQGNRGSLPHTELNMLVDALGSLFEVVIADLGAFPNAHGALIGRLDSVALVGSGDPIGIARLLGAIERMVGMVDEEALVVVVNKTPTGRYHSSEIRAELTAAYPRLPAVLLPMDRRVTESIWQGTVSEAGRFAKGLRRMTGVIEESLHR